MKNLIRVILSYTKLIGDDMHLFNVREEFGLTLHSLKMIKMEDKFLEMKVRELHQRIIHRLKREKVETEYIDQVVNNQQTRIYASVLVIEPSKADGQKVTKVETMKILKKNDYSYSF
jgi:hypothetical protein